MVVSRYPEWLQGTLNVITRILRRYRLLVNVTKSKATTFHMGTLRSVMSEEVVDWWCTVRGETYCKRLIRRIPYPY